jgi:hypothetical protein
MVRLRTISGSFQITRRPAVGEPAPLVLGDDPPGQVEHRVAAGVGQRDVHAVHGADPAGHRQPGDLVDAVAVVLEELVVSMQFDRSRSSLLYWYSPANGGE